MSDEREDLGSPEQPPADGGESAGDRATVVLDAGSQTGSPASLPRHIGRYRILGKLGEGGMGIVYEAEQESPRRRVAVKVIRGGQLVDEAQVRMFQREVETLARLQHPGIGAIYESDRTEDGRHFFAMELVRGETLDAYLARRGPVASAAELEFRLDLFRRIIDAVSYAHQRGVIHRDLKPANIIVSEETGTSEPSGISQGGSPRTRLPAVKVLDFGLARITEHDVAAATKATEVGVIKGTLPYMSPEQARGDPAEVDVRADVYALGVILYEMLSGQRPYDLAKMAIVEALRVICEAPPRPLHASMSGAFRLDRDIETIVGKALEKDAERRYASAAALSEDVSRYLSSQPILARPPSAIYQLRKFAARNKVLVGGVGATVLTLMAGAVMVTVFGIREARQRREAERARNDLELVADFQSGMLSKMDPQGVGLRLRADLERRVGELQQQRGGRESEVAAARDAFAAAVRGVNFTDAAMRLLDEEILARAVKTVGEQFADRPLIDARLRDTIGETYSSLGLYPRAEKQLRTSLELRRGQLGDEDLVTLSSMEHLGILFWLQGRYDVAEELAARTLASRRKVLGDVHADTLVSLNALALVYTKLGRFREAETLLKEALETQRRTLGEEHPDTLATMNNLGVLYNNDRSFEAAQRQLETTLTPRKRVLGADHRDTLHTMINLATSYANQGRDEDAANLLREVLEALRRTLGALHPETLSAANNLAVTYVRMHRYADAEPLHLRTLEIRTRVLGPEHPDTLVSRNNLSIMYFDWGRRDEALRLDEGTLAIRRRVLGDEHPDTLVSVNNLAILYRDTGHLKEAEVLFLEALDTRTRVLGPYHFDTNRARRNLIILYQMQGRTRELEPLLRDDLTTRKAIADRPEAMAAELNDAAWQLLTVEPEELRNPALALRYAQRACAKEEAANGSELWNFLDTLALAQHTCGDTAAAIATEKKALALLAEDRPERKGLQRQLAEYERLIQRQ